MIKMVMRALSDNVGNDSDDENWILLASCLSKASELKEQLALYWADIAY